MALPRISIVLMLAGCVPQISAAQTAADEFERGNVFYRNGQFQEAAASYEAVLRQGVASASLYYNLGNAYYRLNRLAPAILAYERALRLSPNDPDIKHNLDLANLRTVDRIEPLPDLFFFEWLRAISAFLPLGSTMSLFGALWFSLFSSLLLLFVVMHPRVLRLARVIAVAAFVLLIPVSTLMVTQLVEARSRNDAIIMGSVVTAKTSPDAQSVDAFVVHEGLKVKLSDAVGEWVKIVLQDGKVGWIRSDRCERI